MRLVTYQGKEKPRSGLLVGEWVVDLRRAWLFYRRQAGPGGGDWSAPGSILALLQAGPAALRHTQVVLDAVAVRLGQPARKRVLPSRLAVPLSDVRLLPPVTRPGKVLAVGMNYPPFEAEPAYTPPLYPVLFHKTATALAGLEQPVLLPAISQAVEYEGELALVIGQRAKNVPPAEAMAVLAGYTIANDIGARDVQARTSQWTSGKMFDTFCPLGPALVTPEEVPDPDDLRLVTTLNGEIVQASSTAEMIFSVPFLVHYISTLVTLEPGDVILTGSPRRAGQWPDPRRILAPGDRVMVAIDRLGELENPVLAEANHDAD